MTENISLTIPFETFKTSLETLTLEGSELHKTEVDTEEQLTELREKTKNWADRTVNILQSSFTKKDNEYVNDFLSANSNSFSFPGTKLSLKQLVDRHKENIASKENIILGHLRILSVSDAIIHPSNVDLKLRENYSTDEKLTLLLDKLYQLYDDFFYPVKELLVGNGIKLKRSDDDREYAKMLENRGLIKLYQGLGMGINAQLTSEGSMFIENNRKPIKENYDNIKKTPEELEKKIDEIIEYLKTLGYGQEIIFDELEELKSEYKNLNKKTWGQLLKGKLIDLSLAKLIEPDTIKYIYENLTNNQLLLP